MKNLLPNLKIIEETLKPQHIEIHNYEDYPTPHYFIDAKVTIFDKDYFISTGFWDEIDCRVEVIENGIKCNFIEFEHTQDLEEILKLACDKIIESI